jgi:beta-lactam-binding protein with PASTA domain
MNDEMPRPSQLVDGIPQDVEDIVMKATDKYQINRYKSADEMLEALNQASLSTIGVNGGGYGKNRNLGATITMKTVNQESKAEPLNGTAEQENGREKVLKGKKKFKFNKIKVAAIILALICAIPASQLLLTVIEAGTAPKEVSVLDVTGMTVEEATTKMDEIGLLLEVDKEVSSSDYGEGLIVSQDPLSGMIVKTGKTVKVNISKGMEEGTVPNVIGKTLSDAVFLLENYGYNKGGVSEEYSEMPIGVIIKQSPKGGEKVEAGTSISMVVSLGEEIYTTTVPNMIGLDVDQAKTALEREGLALGNIDYAPNNDFPMNLVIGQSVSPGESVDSGTPIDLTISAGPDEIGGSEVVDIPIGYQAAKNEVFYLTVMVSDETGVSTPINYEQRIKSNGSEIFQVSGVGQGTVRIYFDNALVQEYLVDFASGVIL